MPRALRHTRILHEQHDSQAMGHQLRAGRHLRDRWHKRVGYCEPDLRQVLHERSLVRGCAGVRCDVQLHFSGQPHSHRGGAELDADAGPWEHAGRAAAFRRLQRRSHRRHEQLGAHCAAGGVEGRADVGLPGWRGPAGHQAARLDVEPAAGVVADPDGQHDVIHAACLPAVLLHAVPRQRVEVPYRVRALSRCVVCSC